MLSLSDFSLLTDAERNEILSTFNDTDAPVPQQTVHGLFEQAVINHPEKIAIIENGNASSYTELDNRANRIAGYLSKVHQIDSPQPHWVING